jgi:hypothetical protein
MRWATAITPLSRWKAEVPAAACICWCAIDACTLVRHFADSSFPFFRFLINRLFSGHYGDDSHSEVLFPEKKWTHSAFVFDLQSGTQTIYQDAVQVSRSQGHRPLNAPTTLHVG